MRDAKSPHRLTTTIDVDDYNKLLWMVQELNLENVAQLLRRIVNLITLDYFLETNGLPVIKMPNEPKINVVVE